MGWFTQGNDVKGPTPAEAESLWDAEAPEAGLGSATLKLMDAFQVPGSGTVFTGQVDSGTFRVGQQVIITGKAGFARGNIGEISVGQERPESAGVGKYISFNVANLSVRVEILGLDESATVTGL
jgi:translation elongation factor EF-Tu-like GTPase